MRQPKIYLAGPEVFLTQAAELGRRKQQICARHGLAGLFPLDNAIASGTGWDDRIYAANLAMIQAADAGIFNLSPFRGAAADAGTVFELGLMAGLGKPLFGYTNTAADLLARVPDARRGADGTWRDREEMMVEDFGNAENLMIDACLRAGGHPMVRREAGGALDVLDAFETCVRRAAQALRDA